MWYSCGNCDESGHPLIEVNIQVKLDEWDEID